MGARTNGTDQAKITDAVREELMNYIYSNDRLKDAHYLMEIFKELEWIDIRFGALEDENRDLWKQNASLEVELENLGDKLRAEMFKEVKYVIKEKT